MYVCVCLFFCGFVVVVIFFYRISTFYFRLARTNEQAVGQEAGMCWKFPSDSSMERMAAALNGQRGTDLRKE